jgi:hypothetical protein
MQLSVSSEFAESMAWRRFRHIARHVDQYVGSLVIFRFTELPDGSQHHSSSVRPMATDPSNMEEEPSVVQRTATVLDVVGDVYVVFACQ